MLVFWDERLVILAVPKTGSMALAQALGPFASVLVRDPPGLRHAGAGPYHRQIAPLLASRGGHGFETFALMREPVSWLESWYRYRRRPELDGTPNSTRDVDFDGFVQAWCQSPRPAFAQVGEQSSFLAPADAPAVDHIFRYEEMPAALAFLEGRLGRPITPSRINASAPVPTPLRAATLTRLRHTHEAEFALYHSLLSRQGAGDRG